MPITLRPDDEPNAVIDNDAAFPDLSLDGIDIDGIDVGDEIEDLEDEGSDDMEFLEDDEDEDLDISADELFNDDGEA